MGCYETYSNLGGFYSFPPPTQERHHNILVASLCKSQKICTFSFTPVTEQLLGNDEKCWLRCTCSPARNVLRLPFCAQRLSSSTIQTDSVMGFAAGSPPLLPCCKPTDLQAKSPRGADLWLWGKCGCVTTPKLFVL